MSFLYTSLRPAQFAGWSETREVFGSWVVYFATFVSLVSMALIDDSGDTDLLSGGLLLLGIGVFALATTMIRQFVFSQADLKLNDLWAPVVSSGIFAYLAVYLFSGDNYQVTNDFFNSFIPESGFFSYAIGTLVMILFIMSPVLIEVVLLFVLNLPLVLLRFVRGVRSELRSAEVSVDINAGGEHFYVSYRALPTGEETEEDETPTLPERDIPLLGEVIETDDDK